MNPNAQEVPTPPPEQQKALLRLIIDQVLVSQKALAPPTTADGRTSDPEPLNGKLLQF